MPQHKYLFTRQEIFFLPSAADKKLPGQSRIVRLWKRRQREGRGNLIIATQRHKEIRIKAFLQRTHWKLIRNSPIAQRSYCFRFRRQFLYSIFCKQSPISILSIQCLLNNVAWFKLSPFLLLKVFCLLVVLINLNLLGFNNKTSAWSSRHLCCFHLKM